MYPRCLRHWNIPHYRFTNENKPLLAVGVQSKGLQLPRSPTRQMPCRSHHISFVLISTLSMVLGSIGVVAIPRMRANQLVCGYLTTGIKPFGHLSSSTHYRPLLCHTLQLELRNSRWRTTMSYLGLYNSLSSDTFSS